MHILAEYSSQQILMVLGAGIVVVAIMLRTRRQFKQSNHANTHRSARTATSLRGDAACDSTNGVKPRSSNPLADWENLEVELHDLSRQIKGEIDSKLAALSQLVRIADQAAENLNAAIGRAESLGLVEESNSARQSTATHDRSLPFNDAANDFDSNVAVVDAGARHSTQARGGRRTTSGSVYSGRLSSAQLLEDDPRFERVYALADAGFSSSRIASQTGAQVGEVELILSLRPRTASAELVSGQSSVVRG